MIPTQCQQLHMPGFAEIGGEATSAVSSPAWQAEFKRLLINRINKTICHSKGCSGNPFKISLDLKEFSFMQVSMLLSLQFLNQVSHYILVYS